MKITGTLLLLVSCVIATSCTTPQSTIVKARVHDSNFDEVTTFSTPQEINSFTNLWLSREPLKKIAPYNWTHKIDLTSETGGHERWLYSTDGHCALLCYQLKPMYRLKNSENFNELIKNP